MSFSESTQRRLATETASAFLLGAVAGMARGMGRVAPARKRQLVDWRRVYQVASALSASRPSTRLDLRERRRREDQYQGIVERVSPALLDYLGPGLTGQFVFTTRPEVIDRPAWIEANIGSFATVFEPVESLLQERLNRRTDSLLNQQAGSALLGVMLGYLSRHVLGQYDPSLLSKQEIVAGRLYFVEPNMIEARRQMGLDQEQFETWIVFHELTHSWQFEAHQWLRTFMNERVRRLLSLASGKLVQLDATELLGMAMRGELSLRQPQKMLTGLMPPEQKEIFDRLQALMSLLEGFSNHVMDALGPRLLPDYAAIARRFEQRQEHKGQAERVFMRLTGLEMKMEQYRVGQRFVDEVVRQRGIAFMNRAWRDPESLPGPSEIVHPDEWIARLET